MRRINNQFRRVLNWRERKDHENVEAYIIDRSHQVLFLRGKKGKKKKFEQIGENTI